MAVACPLMASHPAYYVTALSPATLIGRPRTHPIVFDAFARAALDARVTERLRVPRAVSRSEWAASQGLQGSTREAVVVVFFHRRDVAVHLRAPAETPPRVCASRRRGTNSACRQWWKACVV